MSMWSLRWHFKNKSITGAPYSIKSYSLSHSWTLWWSTMTETVSSSCHGGTAAVMMQNKETMEQHSTLEQQSITQHGALCGRFWKRKSGLNGVPGTLATFQNTKGNTKHCQESVAWHQPFFIIDARGVPLSMLTLRCHCFNLVCSINVETVLTKFKKKQW